MKEAGRRRGRERRRAAAGGLVLASLLVLASGARPSLAGGWWAGLEVDRVADDGRGGEGRRTETLASAVVGLPVGALGAARLCELREEEGEGGGGALVERCEPLEQGRPDQRRAAEGLVRVWCGGREGAFTPLGVAPAGGARAVRRWAYSFAAGAAALEGVDDGHGAPPDELWPPPPLDAGHDADLVGVVRLAPGSSLPEEGCRARWAGAAERGVWPPRRVAGRPGDVGAGADAGEDVRLAPLLVDGDGRPRAPARRTAVGLQPAGVGRGGNGGAGVDMFDAFLDEKASAGHTFMPPIVPAMIMVAVGAIMDPMMSAAAAMMNPQITNELQSNLAGSIDTGIVEPIVQAVSGPVASNVTNLVVDATTFFASGEVSRLLVEKLAPSFATTVSDGVFAGARDHISSAVGPPLIQRVTEDVSTVLSTSMPNAIAAQVGPAVAHSVVAALSHVLQELRPVTFFVEQCASRGQFCDYAHASDKSYYSSSWSTYYAGYYSRYYSAYYGGALASMGPPG